MLSKVRDFAVVHLAFWRPIRLNEFVRGTPEWEALQREFADWDESIATLDDVGLDYLCSRLRDELSVVHTSISETRSRAAQLLVVTGFVTVLATLGASIPPHSITRALTYAFAVVAVYALLGTLWLTAQALAVRSWDEVKVRAPAHQIALRRLREGHASEMFRVRRRLSIRLDRPVGYLRDAYWFFLSTVISFVILVVLRFLPLP